mgnify:CR=1 FL=1
MNLNEKSEFTIPLKNLLAMIAATGLAVYSYCGLLERVAFLEHEQEMLAVEVEENDAWIDNFKPPDDVIDAVTRVRNLEIKSKEHDMKLYFIMGKR